MATINITINDSVTGEPIIGATVQIKDTTTGTVSNFDGIATLTANIGQTIVISYTGYITKEVQITSTTMTVELDPNSEDYVGNSEPDILSTEDSVTRVPSISHPIRIDERWYNYGGSDQQFPIKRWGRVGTDATFSLSLDGSSCNKVIELHNFSWRPNIDSPGMVGLDWQSVENYPPIGYSRMIFLLGSNCGFVTSESRSQSEVQIYILYPENWNVGTLYYWNLTLVNESDSDIPIMMLDVNFNIKNEVPTIECLVGFGTMVQPYKSHCSGTNAHSFLPNLFVNSIK